jgi:hypothetical protein
VTRAAQRILNRARTSAWRRVGIPARWPDRQTGQIVADEAAKEQGSDRPEQPATRVTPEETEK